MEMLIRRSLGLSFLAILLSYAQGDRDDARSRLVVAIPRDVGPINPYIGATDAMVGLVYDKLIEPSPHEREQHMGLAGSVTQLDSMTWTVIVRDGVRWHDGTAFITRPEHLANDVQIAL